MTIHELIEALEKIEAQHGSKLPVYVDNEDTAYEVPARLSFLEVRDAEKPSVAGVVSIPAMPKRVYIG